MYTIPKRAKQTADIPNTTLNGHRNEWGYPSTERYTFVGYADETAWWVKA